MADNGQSAAIGVAEEALRQRAGASDRGDPRNVHIAALEEGSSEVGRVWNPGGEPAEEECDQAFEARTIGDVMRGEIVLGRGGNSAVWAGPILAHQGPQGARAPPWRSASWGSSIP